jgi:hypothetical protein
VRRLYQNDEKSLGASQRRLEKIADALFVGSALEVNVQMSRVQCSSVEKLMSPFIDSMVTAGEADMIEGHLSASEPCQRQLQSYISMRGLVARLATPPMRRT